MCSLESVSLRRRLRRTVPGGHPSRTASRAPRASRVRVLCGDLAKLCGGHIEHRRVWLGPADADVGGDLCALRRLAWARVTEPLDQRRTDLLVVSALQSCLGHQSSLAPERFAMRMRLPS